MATPRSGSEKRAVNLSVRTDLVEDAKRLGINLSAVFEGALEKERTRREAANWRETNRQAIEEANQELERNGLWSDRLRLF
jgi:antitoxin CcdA